MEDVLADDFPHFALRLELPQAYTTGCHGRDIQDFSLTFGHQLLKLFQHPLLVAGILFLQLFGFPPSVAAEDYDAHHNRS